MGSDRDRNRNRPEDIDSRDGIEQPDEQLDTDREAERRRRQIAGGGVGLGAGAIAGKEGLDRLLDDDESEVEAGSPESDEEAGPPSLDVFEDLAGESDGTEEAVEAGSAIEDVAGRVIERDVIDEEGSEPSIPGRPVERPAPAEPPPTPQPIEGTAEPPILERDSPRTVQPPPAPRSANEPPPPLVDDVAPPGAPTPPTGPNIFNQQPPAPPASEPESPAPAPPPPPVSGDVPDAPSAPVAENDGIDASPIPPGEAGITRPDLDEGSTAPPPDQGEELPGDVPPDTIGEQDIPDDSAPPPVDDIVTDESPSGIDDESASPDESNDDSESSSPPVIEDDSPSSDESDDSGTETSPDEPDQPEYPPTEDPDEEDSPDAPDHTPPPIDTEPDDPVDDDYDDEPPQYEPEYDWPVVQNIVTGEDWDQGDYIATVAYPDGSIHEFNSAGEHYVILDAGTRVLVDEPPRMVDMVPEEGKVEFAYGPPSGNIEIDTHGRMIGYLTEIHPRPASIDDEFYEGYLFLELENGQTIAFDAETGTGYLVPNRDPDSWDQDVYNSTYFEARFHSWHPETGDPVFESPDGSLTYYGEGYNFFHVVSLSEASAEWAGFTTDWEQLALDYLGEYPDGEEQPWDSSYDDGEGWIHVELDGQLWELHIDSPAYRIDENGEREMYMDTPPYWVRYVTEDGRALIETEDGYKILTRDGGIIDISPALLDWNSTEDDGEGWVRVAYDDGIYEIHSDGSAYRIEGTDAEPVDIYPELAFVSNYGEVRLTGPDGIGSVDLRTNGGGFGPGAFSDVYAEWDLRHAMQNDPTALPSIVATNPGEGWVQVRTADGTVIQYQADGTAYRVQADGSLSELADPRVQFQGILEDGTPSFITLDGLTFTLNEQGIIDVVGDDYELELGADAADDAPPPEYLYEDDFDDIAGQNYLPTPSENANPDNIEMVYPDGSVHRFGNWQTPDGEYIHHVIVNADGTVTPVEYPEMIGDGDSYFQYFYQGGSLYAYSSSGNSYWVTPEGQYVAPAGEGGYYPLHGVSEEHGIAIFKTPEGWVEFDLDGDTTYETEIDADGTRGERQESTSRLLSVDETSNTVVFQLDSGMIVQFDSYGRQTMLHMGDESQATYYGIAGWEPGEDHYLFDYDGNLVEAEWDGEAWVPVDYDAPDYAEDYIPEQTYLPEVLESDDPNILWLRYPDGTVHEYGYDADGNPYHYALIAEGSVAVELPSYPYGQLQSIGPEPYAGVIQIRETDFHIGPDGTLHFLHENADYKVSSVDADAGVVVTHTDAPDGRMREYDLDGDTTYVTIIYPNGERGEREVSDRLQLLSIDESDGSAIFEDRSGNIIQIDDTGHVTYLALGEEWAENMTFIESVLPEEAPQYVRDEDGSWVEADEDYLAPPADGSNGMMGYGPDGGYPDPAMTANRVYEHDTEYGGSIEYYDDGTRVRIESDGQRHIEWYVDGSGNPADFSGIDESMNPQEWVNYIQSEDYATGFIVRLHEDGYVMTSGIPWDSEIDLSHLDPATYGDWSDPFAAYGPPDSTEWNFPYEGGMIQTWEVDGQTVIRLIEPATQSYAFQIGEEPDAVRLIQRHDADEPELSIYSPHVLEWMPAVWDENLDDYMPAVEHEGELVPAVWDSLNGGYIPAVWDADADAYVAAEWDEETGSWILPGDDEENVPYDPATAYFGPDGSYPDPAGSWDATFEHESADGHIYYYENGARVVQHDNGERTIEWYVDDGGQAADFSGVNASMTPDDWMNYVSDNGYHVGYGVRVDEDGDILQSGTPFNMAIDLSGVDPTMYGEWHDPINLNGTFQSMTWENSVVTQTWEVDGETMTRVVSTSYPNFYIQVGEPPEAVRLGGSEGGPQLVGGEAEPYRVSIYSEERGDWQPAQWDVIAEDYVPYVEFGGERLPAAWSDAYDAYVPAYWDADTGEYVAAEWDEETESWIFPDNDDYFNGDFAEGETDVQIGDHPPPNYQDFDPHDYENYSPTIIPAEGRDAMRVELPDGTLLECHPGGPTYRIENAGTEQEYAVRLEDAPIYVGNGISGLYRFQSPDGTPYTLNSQGYYLGENPEPYGSDVTIDAGAGVVEYTTQMYGGGEESFRFELRGDQTYSSSRIGNAEWGEMTPTTTAEIVTIDPGPPATAIMLFGGGDHVAIDESGYLFTPYTAAEEAQSFGFHGVEYTESPENAIHVWDPETGSYVPAELYEGVPNAIEDTQAPEANDYPPPEYLGFDPAAYADYGPTIIEGQHGSAVRLQLNDGTVLECHPGGPTYRIENPGADNEYAVRVEGAPIYEGNSVADFKRFRDPDGDEFAINSRGYIVNDFATSTDITIDAESGVVEYTQEIAAGYQTVRYELRGDETFRSSKFNDGDWSEPSPTDIPLIAIEETPPPATAIFLNPNGHPMAIDEYGYSSMPTPLPATARHLGLHETEYVESGDHPLVVWDAEAGHYVPAELVDGVPVPIEGAEAPDIDDEVTTLGEEGQFSVGLDSIQLEESDGSEDEIADDTLYLGPSGDSHPHPAEAYDQSLQQIDLTELESTLGWGEPTEAHLYPDGSVVAWYSDGSQRVGWFTTSDGSPISTWQQVIDGDAYLDYQVALVDGVVTAEIPVGSAMPIAGLPEEEEVDRVEFYGRYTPNPEAEEEPASEGTGEGAEEPLDFSTEEAQPGEEPEATDEEPASFEQPVDVFDEEPPSADQHDQLPPPVDDDDSLLDEEEDDLDLP